MVITISNLKYWPVFIFGCWFQDKIFRLDIYSLSSPCHASGLFLYTLKFSGGIEREQSHEMNHSVTEQLPSCFILIVFMVLVIWWHQVFQWSFEMAFRNDCCRFSLILISFRTKKEELSAVPHHQNFQKFSNRKHHEFGTFCENCNYSNYLGRFWYISSRLLLISFMTKVPTI